MSAANPSKATLEAMLAGQVYTDGSGQRRNLIVSDDDDGSYETVRVALLGVHSTDSPEALWQIECSAPYGSDLRPVVAVVLKTLYDAGFAFHSPPVADPRRQEHIGDRITATVVVRALTAIWEPAT